MTEPLIGKVQEDEYKPHDNYDYETHTVNHMDHFVFKRGNEAIEVGLAHPHVEELRESSPRFNDETAVSYTHLRAHET